MTDRYQEIRAALAMGPTPGEWYWSDAYPTQDGRKTWSLIGDGGFGILSCDGDENSPQSVNVAAAELIAACDPDTIRELLAERDALAAENERLKEDRARFPNKPDDIGRMIETHIGNLKSGKKSTEALADKAFDRAFRAEAALAEKDKEIAALRKALGRILENEASDWKAAEAFGGYVLDDELREAARAALGMEDGRG